TTTTEGRSARASKCSRQRLNSLRRLYVSTTTVTSDVQLTCASSFTIAPNRDACASIARYAAKQACHRYAPGRGIDCDRPPLLTPFPLSSRRGKPAHRVCRDRPAGPVVPGHVGHSCSRECRHKQTNVRLQRGDPGLIEHRTPEY